MFKAKYIIINGMTPVVFPETLTHADVKFALAPGGECTGAGFVHINEDAYHCYGESVSLQVKSNGPEDSKILNRYLGGQGDW